MITASLLLDDIGNNTASLLLLDDLGNNGASPLLDDIVTSEPAAS